MSSEMVRARRTGRDSKSLVLPSFHGDYVPKKKKKETVMDVLKKYTVVKYILAVLPGSPAYMTFKKKVAITKRSSTFGLVWDIVQVLFSILACAIYVSETYIATYLAAQIYHYTEIVVTQFFLVDFLFNWFVAPSTIKYFKSFMTLVDVVTIVPVYVSMSFDEKDVPNLSLLRFLRILRLIRILRTFRLLGGVSGLKRQLITLSLTLLSLTFMAGGVVQVMENDVKQLTYDCQYINALTDFEPSCYSTMPLGNITGSCDCDEHSCVAAYVSGDPEGEPSYIRCNELPYFNCFYFIVVTMATVGYGDIYPSSGPSKVVIILFIVTSLIVIPMQVNKLTLLLSMSSAFRSTYTPQNHENHVVVCGHVNDASKLERLFKEFFHPGRHVSSAPDFHLVILSPSEPPEEVRTLLVSPLFDSRVSYIIGSALSTEDLQRARADIASAMLFVCNVEVESQAAFFDDAATVLRTLSVNNFNRDLTCLVQVLRAEDRDILKDSDVDVVLCLDEFKTAIQARNSICPGLSTLIDNVFHTFTSSHTIVEDSRNWLNEYLHGARMEMYFIPLEKGFLECMNFDWDLLCEAVYVEFGRILAGVCCVDKHAIVFNPGEFEMRNYFNAEEFFCNYNVAVIMATSQDEANSIANTLSDYQSLERIMVRMLAVEEDFAVRNLPNDREDKLRSTNSSLLSRYSLGTTRVAVDASFKDVISYSKMNRMLKKDSLTVKDCEERVCPSELGLESRQRRNAMDLSDHVIVFGCTENIHLFVHELRRPLIQGSSYRPIVIISEVEPVRWSLIKSSYKDVYFIESSMTSSDGFNASNVRDAFAIILLASRDSVTMVEEENLDAETLFAFLKLERYVPRYVYFTVELTCANNMSVLNSTIMRRSRSTYINKKRYVTHKEPDTAFNMDKDDNLNEEKQALQHSQVRGTFSSQKKVVVAKELNTNSQKQQTAQSNPGRRIDSIYVDTAKTNNMKKDDYQAPRNFWDLPGTHHVLPVFAAGRSYVPSGFDTLLCQSFFSSLAPLMCERLVCGEGSQTIVQQPIPPVYYKHSYVDLFRAYRSRGILVLGLYRSALMSTGSALPYVFTSPWASTILRGGDFMYLYGHPKVVAKVTEEISQNFVVNKKGNFGLVCSLDGGKPRARTVSRSVNAPRRMPKSQSSSFKERALRRSESKSSVENANIVRSFDEEKTSEYEHDINSYQPRHRTFSRSETLTIPEKGVCEDLTSESATGSKVTNEGDDEAIDLDSKGFQAFKNVMAGHSERQKAKEEQEIAAKIKKNETGMRQYLDHKKNKGNSKEHAMATLIQKQVRGFTTRKKSGNYS